MEQENGGLVQLCVQYLDWYLEFSILYIWKVKMKEQFRYENILNKYMMLGYGSGLWQNQERRIGVVSWFWGKGMW